MTKTKDTTNTPNESASSSLHRRKLVGIAAAAIVLRSGGTYAQADKWGASQGYPTGWAGGFSRNTAYRVGNYSGGYENMVRVRRIGAKGGAAPMPATVADIRFRRGSSWATPSQYLDAWPVTGLLIARRGVSRFDRCLAWLLQTGRRRHPLYQCLYRASRAAGQLPLPNLSERQLKWFGRYELIGDNFVLSSSSSGFIAPGCS